MIKLYGFGPAFGLPDASPFVTKVSCHLRVHSIEYESLNGPEHLRNAPKSKLPFIDDDGKVVADSVFIIDHLKCKYGFDVDDWLSDEQKAIAQLISKSIDENLYWSIVHSRWINEDTWPTIKAEFFDSMPFPLSKIIPVIARRSTRKQIEGHGIGKHSDKEIQDIARRSLDSLSAMLGSKAYFLGDKISSLDIAVFSHFSGLGLTNIENEMNTLAQSYENLMAHAQKIKTAYYPEL